MSYYNIHYFYQFICFFMALSSLYLTSIYIGTAIPILDNYYDLAKAQ